MFFHSQRLLQLILEGLFANDADKEKLTENWASDYFGFEFKFNFKLDSK